MNPIQRYRNNAKAMIEKSKPTFIVLTILRLLILVAMIRSIMIGNYEGTATCVLTLLLLLIPNFLEGALKINIPPLFEGIIYCFIFAANILGELANRNNKNIKLSPLYLTLVAFCVSMTIGVLWEFFECGMDIFFGKDMQKDFFVTTINSCELDPAKNQTLITIKDIVSTQITTASGEVFTINDGYLDIGILDTMKDLFVNFIGAVVFCIFGLIYETVGNKSKTAAKVVEGLRIKPADE